MACDVGCQHLPILLIRKWLLQIAKVRRMPKEPDAGVSFRMAARTEDDIYPSEIMPSQHLRTFSSSSKNQRLS